MTLSHSHDPRSDVREDHLELLTLSLELQLDVLLVAFGPDEGSPWTLDLTGPEPVLGEADASGITQRRREWLADRYRALEQAVEEMLENPEVRRHSAVVTRLEEARHLCVERLLALSRHAEPRSLTVPTPGGQASRSRFDRGPRVEAGHFLG